MSIVGVPASVAKALDDLTLPQSARLMMWEMTRWLDFTEFRPIKLAALAHVCRLRESTVSEYLTLLTARGYLDERRGCRPREFRMPWSQLTSERRRAA